MRTEALEILQDVLIWRTRPDAWKEISRIVEAMAEAVSSDDPDALAARTGDLELSSPLRVIRIGDTDGDPAPEHLRERVNHLIHALEPSDPAEETDAAHEPPGRRGERSPDEERP